MQQTHFDADGESAVAHYLDGLLHLQRPDVPDMQPGLMRSY
jgi:hypothetical protein